MIADVDEAQLLLDELVLYCEERRPDIDADAQIAAAKEHIAACRALGRGASSASFATAVDLVVSSVDAAFHAAHIPLREMNDAAPAEDGREIEILEADCASPMSWTDQCCQAEPPPSPGPSP